VPKVNTDGSDADAKVRHATVLTGELDRTQTGARNRTFGGRCVTFTRRGARARRRGVVGFARRPIVCRGALGLESIGRLTPQDENSAHQSGRKRAQQPTANHDFTLPNRC
jgi:hypothetical protein